MKRGWLPALGIVVVLGGLTLLARQFLKDETPVAPIETAKATTAAAPPVAVPVAETTQPNLIAATRNVEAPVAPPPEPPSSAVPTPASYRKALSGVHGRLVEEDGKPVAGLQVELLEITGNGLLGDFEHALAKDSKQGCKIPELAIARAKSGEDGVFELHGALRGAFHGLSVDAGGARSTLRFLDRSLQSGETTDVGDVVMTGFVTWKGTVVDDDGNPIPDARVRATLLPIVAFQPGVPDVGRVAALMEVRTWGEERIEVYEIPDTVKAWESRLPFPTTRSKADGTFELAGVPTAGALPVTLIVDREGFAGIASQQQASKTSRDVGKLELTRGRSVSGTVVDAAGKPVANAQVVGGVAIDAVHLAIAFAAAAPTDADGHFKLDHLSELGGSIKVAARAHPSDRFVATSTDGETATITIPVGFPVDVKLAKRGGGGVADAELSLRLADGPPFLTWGTLQRVPADRVEHVEDGHVRLLGVQPGRWDLVGHAAGFGTTLAHFEVKDAASEATLEFAPARTLTVSVTDRDTKQPIEFAEVSAGPQERMVAAFVTRRTDANGVAQLAELGSEPLTIRAYHPAYAATSQLVKIDELPADATRVEFTLGPGATLHGVAHRDASSAVQPMLFLLEPSGERRSADDDMPTFAVPGLDGTFTLRGLPPGEHRWEFMPRFFDGDPQLAVTKIVQLRQADETRRGKVVLEEGKTTELALDAVAEPGKPGRVTGILHVKGGGDARFKIGLQVSKPNSGESTHKDVEVRANQHFTIEPVQPGWVNVSIDRRLADADGHEFGSTIHRDWFELTDGEEHVLELDFEFASAQVHVVDAAGHAAANTGVSFEWTVERGDATSKFNFSQSVWGQTDKDGVARVELPHPGHYTAKSSQSGQGRGSIEFDAPTSDPVELRLDPGVPCAGRIEIEPDPGSNSRIWLSVALAADEKKGEPVGWQQLEHGKRDFEFSGLQPGKYRANIFVASGEGDAETWSKNMQVDFELRDGGDRRLLLRFKSK